MRYLPYSEIDSLAFIPHAPIMMPPLSVLHGKTDTIPPENDIEDTPTASWDLDALHYSIMYSKETWFFIS